MSKRMTTALIVIALQLAQALRKPAEGLLHHSDRGAQCTSQSYRIQVTECGIRCSMIGRGNCYDKTVLNVSLAV